MLETVLFAALAVLAVAAGVAVFRTDSMARASYALAASFVAVGLMLLQFRLEYIGVITVLMMVMEMAIMAIFMIMFMGMNPALMPMDMVHSKKVAASAAVGLFLLLATGILLADWPEGRAPATGNLTESLGGAVMGSKMLVMLVVSPVLFATLVSALVLANPRGRYAAYPAVPAEDDADDGGNQHGAHADDDGNHHGGHGNHGDGGHQ
ncbi:NADH:ubiquinone oxidoreductase subunit 6 (subunit J) [Pseudarthrobacter defluvii]|uniref:NADH-quinone oxidoreductase subunit J n=1 Tax=Pseudarthrobacter defluvii TaxID=410837 RepID=UPI0027834C74|nr:NADH-quinone oxidoreductase subunit J [Pseudarthrobacter defluvii]MDQ0768007.1 NADH:ubiquinone oxidoreductase subunit 6 (subunit J) [Pseudarthrobacter defluvii]